MFNPKQKHSLAPLIDSDKMGLKMDGEIFLCQHESFSTASPTL